MAKRDRPGGSSPPTKKSKDKSGEVEVLCLKCNKHATEDSVECECCFKWEHRTCAGISEDEYEIISDSSPNIMFFCSLCRPKVALALKFFNEIEQKQKSLDEKVKQLEEKVNTLASSTANTNVETVQPEASSATTNTVISHVTNKSVPPPKPNSIPNARKFNVVLFGLAECPKGTKKFDREQSDLNNATTILSKLDNSIQPFSIRDVVRLGKYNPTGRSRPLLVTLNRSADVTTILSKRAQMKSPYTVKADLSKEARDIESHLLRVRWSLIQDNIPKSAIKIRGNKIYINDKLHGQADSTGFRPASALNNSNTPASANSATSMDTSTSTGTSSA